MSDIKSFNEFHKIDEIAKDISDDKFHVYNVGNEDFAVNKKDGGALEYTITVKGKEVSFTMSPVDIKRFIKWIKKADQNKD